MSYHAVDPNALEVRRDALDRASRFLDQSTYAANARGLGANTPTVAELTSTADSILAWLTQPLPVSPEGQQAINAQGAGQFQGEGDQSWQNLSRVQFRDLTTVTRHSGPGGLWHAGPYQLCPICQVGHGAIPPASGCSPLAQAQHAVAQADSPLLAAFARTLDRMGNEGPPSATTGLTVVPGVGPSAEAADRAGPKPTLVDPPRLERARSSDYGETGLSSTYKTPY